MKNIKFELDDIQGFIIRSYVNLSVGRYIMLSIKNPMKAKEWIGEIREKITTANIKPSEVALQIAFSNHGIDKLVPKEIIKNKFRREFTEGIATETRSRILGDIEKNSPAYWIWNKPGSNTLDIILLLFAKDSAILEREYSQLQDKFQAFAINEIIKLDASFLPENKEHFGFKDGISSVLLKGLEKTEFTSQNDEINTIMPGEFILGYPNEYNKIPYSPAIVVNKTFYDLGKNGTYMVFRQLEQDVKGFWKFLNGLVTSDPHFLGQDPIYLASKMMGRWPNGNPLTEVDNPKDPLIANPNSFMYLKNDSDGSRCPIGAHIRRTNPRDSLDNDPEASLIISKKHKIIRRSRTYGSPLPMESVNSDHTTTERGLFFICFNANINRQFEFIQQVWVNNSKFEGLYNDVDPIIGFPYLAKKYINGEFTIPSCPVRKKIYNIPQFVYVKGGAYFFMPGIKALQILSLIEA